MQAHLGGGVQGKLRRARAKAQQKARILHEDGVDGQGAGEAHELHGALELLVAQQGVDGKMDAHAAGMAVADGAAQSVVVEIMRKGARREGAASEIDGVRSGCLLYTSRCVSETGTEPLRRSPR